MKETTRIPGEIIKDTFYSILLKHRFSKESAKICAEVFTENSIDGVYSHGINRFASFINLVKKGFILPDKEPVAMHRSNAFEQWDGGLAPGMLNALFCTDRAMDLAQQHGIGAVAISNTNHWMRGGYYGWRAAKRNFIFIGWTNTIANMPAWGAIDARLGNNPLVMAVPFGAGAIVLDMAMSQFSYGALEMFHMRNEELPVDGGFTSTGEVTRNPADILKSKRVMPVGYWKGAGLSLLLDILSAVLSGGLSTHEISARQHEYSISQVFIAIDTRHLKNYQGIQACIEHIIDDYKHSVAEKNSEILYPGERVLRNRQRNLKEGVPVVSEVWKEIQSLAE